jgi:hypothetical protein
MLSLPVDQEDSDNDDDIEYSVPQVEDRDEEEF